MRTVDLIQKKRDGNTLTGKEIRFLIEGYCRGDIPDYQISAWLMAVFFQGMTAGETAELTMAMAQSGDQADLSGIRGIKVDKHSTGGVGDTTTLVLVPLVAAAGVPVAKMSGRGLGHTGGTIDKFESIRGFQAELSRQRFIDQVNAIGAAVIGQSGNMTPADKKLYGLRDVTATVNSIPLIASSIMSKKIAAGADAIVLDVKTGRGAFMKSLDESVKLAQAMVDIGTHLGRETIALITDMEEPLGRMVGNALEVREAIDALHGRGPSDLLKLCFALGSQMLVAGGIADNVREATERLEAQITNGNALQKLIQLVEAQGGDAAVIRDPNQLPAASRQIPVPAQSSGFVQAIHAEEIGLCAMMLGAGRTVKQSAVDLAVGIELLKKTGDTVQCGEPLAILHVNETAGFTDHAASRITASYCIGSKPPKPKKLIHAVVTQAGIDQILQ